MGVCIGQGSTGDPFQKAAECWRWIHLSDDSPIDLLRQSDPVLPQVGRS